MDVPCQGYWSHKKKIQVFQPQAPIGNLELLLTGSTGTKITALVHFECDRYMVHPTTFIGRFLRHPPFSELSWWAGKLLETAESLPFFHLWPRLSIPPCCITLYAALKKILKKTKKKTIKIKNPSTLRGSDEDAFSHMFTRAALQMLDHFLLLLLHSLQAFSGQGSLAHTEMFVYYASLIIM